MIRQDELPWQGRITRARRSAPAGCTRPPLSSSSLSAAASIVRAGVLDMRQVRLMTTDGTDTGFGSGQSRLHGVLDYLAGAHTHAGTTLAGSLSRLSRDRDHGGLAVVTTELIAATDLAGLERLAPGYGSEAIVIFNRSSWDGGARAGGQDRLRYRRGTIVVSTDLGFPEAWNRAMMSPLSSSARRS